MSTEADFYADWSRRETELEEARANRDADPETWERVRNEFAVWRRALRLLGGRPIGDPPWPADVVDYIRAHPDDPRSVVAVDALRAAHAAELESLSGAE